jgi:hypothetical protein
MLEKCIDDPSLSIEDIGEMVTEQVSSIVSDEPFNNQ